MNESLRCRFLDKKYIGEKLNMENKVRYKLHKVKKQWVTLAVASVALATIVGASVTTSSLVSAEEINNTNGSPSTTTVGENTNPVVEKEVGTTTEVAILQMPQQQTEQQLLLINQLKRQFNQIQEQLVIELQQ